MSKVKRKKKKRQHKVMKGKKERKKKERKKEREGDRSMVGTLKVKHCPISFFKNTSE